MTTFARPEDYEAELGQLEPLLPDASLAALNRIATALEQIALALIDRPQAPVVAPMQPLAALPPVMPRPMGAALVCPVHNQPWKTVPAGVSKKTGNAYPAFQACPVQGCDQRP